MLFCLTTVRKEYHCRSGGVHVMSCRVVRLPRGVWKHHILYSTYKQGLMCERDGQVN